MGKRNKSFIILAALIVVAFLALSGFVGWAGAAAKPMPEATAALVSDADVLVTTDDWITFQPADGSAEVGLIIYPGGRVDPRAYAPAARAIASQGYQVVIVPMPLNLAVFDANAADAVLAANPAIQTWAIAGHSLGGSMAAQYVHNQPDKVDGVALWAAYPAENANLSAYTGQAVSIYGTEDGLATVEDIENAADLLPNTVQWWKISGGNHAQFGWYGEQTGDHAATISRTAQQDQIIAATLSLLHAIQKP
jgi:pimeloyl-ACP methyl ester carboxylesterase